MIEIPDAEALLDAAGVLRRAAGHRSVLGPATEWRESVAAWLENEAAKRSQRYMCHYWPDEPPTGPVGGPGFTPCAKCVPVDA